MASTTFLPLGAMRAKLDMSAKVSSASTGQPLTMVSDNGNGAIMVLPCADDVVPDYVGGVAPVQKAVAGSIHPIYAGAPISLGGTVVRGDKLMVSGGQFVKATTGKKAICCAASDGGAGDIIQAAPIPVVA
jgi:hypothetical protein